MEQKKEEAKEDPFLSGPFLIWSIVVRPSYLSSPLPGWAIDDVVAATTYWNVL